MHYSISQLKFVVRLVLYGFLLLGTGCTPTPITTPLVPLKVQYSFATRPWLTKLYTCVGKNDVAVEQRSVGYQDINSANLVMRIGRSNELTAPSFQIGTDDLLVIINHQNLADKLTSEQVKALFTGRIQTWDAINGISTPVEVWVFSSGEDVQMIFNQSFLGGSAVTSLARLATGPEEMLQAVSNDANAIGLITRSLKSEETLEVFTVVSNLPVLAITPSEPQGNLAQVVACLQK